MRNSDLNIVAGVFIGGGMVIAAIALSIVYMLGGF
jgi:hypothetical protein